MGCLPSAAACLSAARSLGLGLLAVLAVGLLAPAARSVSDEPAAASQEGFMKARGLVRHAGRWRTPQEVWLLEQRSLADKASRDWAARLERLRSECEDPTRSSVAIESIREIDDPLAVAALSAAVANEPLTRARSWYVEALARIGTSDAIACLAAIGLDHADPETRIAAVDQLAVDQPPLATAGFLTALRGPDNARINRAAEALGRLGDPAAVLPLIAVLETEHVVVDPGSGGAISATFTPGQGGLSTGGGPTQRRLRVRNEAVLEALMRLTGHNFEWRADAWRAWLASEQNPDGFDPRRS
ncbi:MAG: HEAT repeat domain-containing protein [Pirellulales bacterium]|nr:HEAT repeat domain-containing protein [Pirellulales bacterium]MBL7193622.1 HEAT repeat domain-containing protein [Pirellulales bacterium]